MNLIIYPCHKQNHVSQRATIRRCLMQRFNMCLHHHFRVPYFSAASNLRDFRVVTTEKSGPTPSAFELLYRGYRLCGSFLGSPLARATVSIECGSQAIGRYLYIYRAAQNTILTLCEVEVFGEGACSIVINTVRPGKMFTILRTKNLKGISLSGNLRIWIKVSMKFVPKSPIDNKADLVQIMGCCRVGEKSSSEQMTV